jgi:hypothetical protein
MGFISFMKKVLFGADEDDAELRAARARHGIVLDKTDTEEARESDEPEKEPYDVWEEVRNMRGTFLFGSWASRKFRIIGEDKVKAELEALEKKREEERKKKEEGEG